MNLILASSSPRRQEILRSRGYSFTIEAADIDEALDPQLPLTEAVTQTALRKAQKVQKNHPGDVIVGADTMVIIDGAALGKPVDGAQAAVMLKSLSGAWHQVVTGVAVLSPRGEKTFFVRTDVKFYELPDSLIAWYIATGEPLDKAGAYGIQGHGALLIEQVSGDYLNIVGLPMGELAKALAGIGMIPAK
jgi:septum formation protein